MSARLSGPISYRRTAVAAGVLAAALTVGTVAPAMADPLVTLTVAPADYSNDSTPEFVGTTGNAGAEVQVFVDDASIGDFTSDGDNGSWSATSENVTDGWHTWEIWIDGDPVQGAEFYVDATAPVVSLDTTPPEESTETSATFGWSASDDAEVTYYWRLDDASPFSGEDTSWTYGDDTALAVGQHSFEVWAEDSYGNESDSVQYSFAVVAPDVPDAPAPSIAWVTQPAASSTSTSAHFVVAVPTGAQVEYVLDLPADAQSASATAVNSDFTLTGLAVGHHKIQVAATLDDVYSQVLVYEWDVTGVATAPAAAASTPVLAKDAIPAAVITRGIKAGASGPSVAIIQKVVGADADGKFGSKTKSAVVAFQRAHGLYPDGIVGPLTWAAIVDVANGGTGATPITATSIPKAQILKGIKRGASGPSVSTVQRALGATVTGTFDAKTAASVKAFQRKHGLVADGIVGPRTWAALVG